MPNNVLGIMETENDVRRDAQIVRPKTKQTPPPRRVKTSRASLREIKNVGKGGRYAPIFNFQTTNNVGTGHCPVRFCPLISRNQPQMNTNKENVEFWILSPRRRTKMENGKWGILSAN